jgi:LPS-assembly lipoprotein
MWWREIRKLGPMARLAVVLATAGLTAGCWQPLYGNGAAPGAPVTPGAESIQDKFAATAVDIALAPALKGTPTERVAIGMRNALEFNLHNGANAFAPIYQLKITVSTGQFTAVLDPTSGRPNTQIDNVAASYQLIELATGKVVVTDHCFAHVDYDIPGSQQRFAKQSALRDAEDRAVKVAAETIRNRLASYFVAGT